MAASKRTDSESEGPSGSTQSLGAKLRGAREARQLAIDDLAAELRIAEESLIALEEDRFDALGAPVFAKGYLKQYGARLGLDVGVLASEFDKSPASARVVIAPSRTIRLRDDRQIKVWIASALALALVVAFLLIWWLGLPYLPIG
jgi:cytoskeleton protein RodZ